MNQRLALLICLIFLTQAILVSPVKSYGQFPPAAVVGRYILQADKYWIAYNKTVEQLRTEGYDVPGDPSWLLQANYTRLNYTFKCRIVELSWPNVTSQNFEGGYDLNVTAHRIMDDGSIGEKLASFLRPNQPAHLGFLWKCHDPGFGVGFNPAAFIIGNQFSTALPPLNIEYSVDGTEILSDTPWGQNATYVLHGRFENSSHCYKNTGWCDAESGLYMKLIWDSKTPRYVAHEEMKTIETGIDVRARARFNGTAVGECFVGVGWVIGPQPPVAAFLGEGAVRVRGSCAVDEYPPSINTPFAYYYAAEGAKASGTLSAKWDDQMIRVSIHSEDNTCGVFIDEGDVNYFTVGGLP